MCPWSSFTALSFGISGVDFDFTCCSWRPWIQTWGPLPFFTLPNCPFFSTKMRANRVFYGLLITGRFKKHEQWRKIHFSIMQRLPDILDRHARTRPAPRTLQQEWRQTPQNVIRRLILSMGPRYNAWRPSSPIFPAIVDGPKRGCENPWLTPLLFLVKLWSRDVTGTVLFGIKFLFRCSPFRP